MTRKETTLRKENLLFSKAKPYVCASCKKQLSWLLPLTAAFTKVKILLKFSLIRAPHSFRSLKMNSQILYIRELSILEFRKCFGHLEIF